MSRHIPARKHWLAVPLSGWLLLMGCAQDTGAVAQGPVLQPLPKETKVAKETKRAPPQPMPALRTTPAELQTQKAEGTDKQPSTVKETAKKPAIRSLIVTVKLALLADPRLFRRDIEVGQDEQGVVLTGKVASEEEKLAATEVAKAIDGVSSVINKLEVITERPQEVAKSQARASFRASDEAITSSIKDRFSKSATLKAVDFGVKTEDGVVSLSGSTRFQVIALEAAEAARDIPGVKAVRTDGVRLEGMN